ncbi:MAG TPA: hypothetical protein VG796_18775 [Verrucomicrobiales bacterium]|nr:hypothetical protein [Verrucomicrobiales bacterium]
MKRKYLLYAGILLGVVSVAFNIQLYFVKSERQMQSVAPPKEEQPKPDNSSVFSGVNFDFSDTAFNDNAWKLSEPESAVKIDKPFDWEDVNPVQPREDSEKQKTAPKESYAGSPPASHGSTIPSVQAPK